LLGMLEVVEAEADDLARTGDRQRKLQAGQRSPRRGMRALGDVAERREVAVIGGEPLPEVGGHARLDRPQVGHRVALDHPEMQASILLEPDNSHGWHHPFSEPTFYDRARPPHAMRSYSTDSLSPLAACEAAIKPHTSSTSAWNRGVRLTPSARGRA